MARWQFTSPKDTPYAEVEWGNQWSGASVQIGATVIPSDAQVCKDLGLPMQPLGNVRKITNPDISSMAAVDVE